MTTGPGTGRLSTSEVARALLNRTPSAPESSVELTRNAKGDVQISVTVRAADAGDAESACVSIFAATAGDAVNANRPSMQ